MPDPFNLQRFLDAQEESYPQALAELKRGRKTSHWMWFVFPQLSGLGRSEIAQFYSISSSLEASAYLCHPVLGHRLLECCESLLQIGNASAFEVFGFPDDMKLKSSVTLFSQVSEPGSVFDKILAKYFGGNPDPRTLELLKPAR